MHEEWDFDSCYLGLLVSLAPPDADTLPFGETVVVPFRAGETMPWRMRDRFAGGPSACGECPA